MKYESEYYSEEVSIGLNDAVTSNQAIDLNENGEIDAVPLANDTDRGLEAPLEELEVVIRKEPQNHFPK